MCSSLRSKPAASSEKQDGYSASIAQSRVFSIIFEQLTVTFVIVLTSYGYGCTKTVEHRLAAADVYAAQQTRQSAGGGLAKTATLRNRAAGELRVLAAEQCRE